MRQILHVAHKLITKYVIVIAQHWLHWYISKCSWALQDCINNSHALVTINSVFTLVSRGRPARRLPWSNVFYLAINNIIKSLLAELRVTFLRNLGSGGDASTVANYLIKLETLALWRGLKFNRSKFVVMGHTSDSRLLFIRSWIIMEMTRETVFRNTTMLGVSLFKGPYLDNDIAFTVKRVELERLSTRLILMPSLD